jgi:transcriptional regulator with XRE-family HTH domain
VAAVNPNERARRIRQARLNAGLSQEELAKKLQVTPRTIGRWETALAAPRGRNLRLLAEVTGKSIDSLRGVVQPDVFPWPRPTVDQELERIALDLDRLASRETVDPHLAAVLKEFRDCLFDEARYLEWRGPR